MPTHQFYTLNYSDKEHFKQIKDVRFHVFWEEKLNSVISRELKEREQTWILFGHNDNSEIDYYQNEIGQEFKILEFKEYKSAAAMLVRKKRPH